jgi:DNA-binding GntR family transcriptional regulator
VRCQWYLVGMPAGTVRRQEATSLADRAYDAIKSAIVRCTLAPGSRVSEAQLAATFEFGKAGIRTALHRLSQEGLVVAVARQGYFISSVTTADVIDLFSVRLMLEPAAARLAAGRVDRKQLRDLDRLCRVGYDLKKPKSVERFQQVNKEFHLLITEAAGSPRLTRILAGILDESHRLHYLGLTLPSADHPAHDVGHRQLVDAIESGDPDRAEEVAKQGIVEAQRNCVDRLLNLPTVRSAELPINDMLPR